MAALRRSGCKPVRTNASRSDATTIRGVVPPTGKTLTVTIGPNRDATRAALQYRMY